MLHGLYIKHIQIAFYTVKCRLGSEWVTWANPRFCICFWICDFLIIGTAIFSHNFYFFSQHIAKNFSSKLFVLQKATKIRFEILSSDVVGCIASFLRAYSKRFAEKHVQIFWAIWKETIFAYPGRKLKRSKSRDILCVHSPSSLNASTSMFPNCEGVGPLLVQLRSRSSVRDDKSSNKWL